MSSITRNDIVNFYSTLFKLLTKIKQKSRYKNKSLDEILDLSKDDSKISASTIKKYITRINQFFNYCYESNYNIKTLATNTEITQLLVSDVTQKDGVLCFNIAPDSQNNKNIKTKTYTLSAT